MTKRLEEEYARYIAEHKGGAPGDTVTLNVKDMAEHFYNLALEDVKAEVKSRIKQAREFAKRARVAKDHTVSYSWDCTAESYNNLIQFIDNQKAK